MNITITINTDNAAFADGNAGDECARILRKLAIQFDAWPGDNAWDVGLRDINGNKVGKCDVA